MSDSLWPHGLQHDRLPCPSLSPGVCSNSCPLSWWCYLTISSSATLFSFCLQSFPASGSFTMSQLFTSGGQNIGASASASASVLTMDYSGMISFSRLTDLISLQSKGLSRVFSNTTVQKPQFFGVQPSLWSNFQAIHDYWKNHSFIWTFVGKVMSLLFNTLSRFVKAFLLRSNHLLISQQALW